MLKKLYKTLVGVCCAKQYPVSNSFWKSCPEASLNSPLLNLEAIWVDDLSFRLDLVIFSFANHVVALTSESPDPLMILPRYLVIWYNLFSCIRCGSAEISHYDRSHTLL